MNYGTCPTCQVFADMDHHACPPIWLVYRIEKDKGELYVYEPTDPDEVRGYSADSVAKTWAKEYDSGGGEYEIVEAGESDPTYVLVVRKDKPETRSIISVYGVAEPAYYARTDVHRYIPEEAQTRLMAEI
jgi:hypothetical protein